MTTNTTPPEAEASLDEFRKALHGVEGRDVDPLTAPWTTIEQGVIKLLGGAFDPQDPNHQPVAFMLASALAERLRVELGAFWFANRGAPGGASLGFPDAVIVVSPLEVALQALSAARLQLFDQVTTDVRSALAAARFGPDASAGARRLGVAEYQQLFDPGMIQFVAMDLSRVETVLKSTPEAAAREIESAIGRLPAHVPGDVKESMRRQLVGALGQAQPGKPLRDQATQATQLVELLAALHGARVATGFAPEEIWHDVSLPLLHAGAPDTFPELDGAELEALKQGADPLLLFIDVVPYKFPVPDEDGLLGVFPLDELGLIDECFAGARGVRIVRVKPSRIAEPLAHFDAKKTRDAIIRFRDHAFAQAGTKPDEQAAEAADTPFLTGSIGLIDALAHVLEAVRLGDGVLCVRRATEAEAGSERALHLLRQALAGPRIVLA